MVELVVMDDEDLNRISISQAKFLLRIHSNSNHIAYAEGKSEGAAVKQLFNKKYVKPFGAQGRRIRWKLISPLSPNQIHLLGEIVAGETNKNNREEILANFTKNISSKIWKLSIVSSDWLNELKVYKNAKISEDIAYGLWIYTFCALVEIFLERIEDLVTKEEKRKLEMALIDNFGETMKQQELEKRQGGITNVKNSIYTILEDEKLKRLSQKKSILENYTELIRSEKQEIAQYLLEYFTSKILLFESENFRSKLREELQ